MINVEKILFINRICKILKIRQSRQTNKKICRFKSFYLRYINCYNFSNFFFNILFDELKNNSVSKIYVSGVSMSNGVLKTARDGADLGFEAMIIEDACADRKLKNFQKTKIDEIPKFGKLIKTKEIIEELNKNV